MAVKGITRKSCVDGTVDNLAWVVVRKVHMVILQRYTLTLNRCITGEI